jgi:D-arabinose 1-dehydrogenase-like Zn-dependent alcohol dehydrogenase
VRAVVYDSFGGPLSVRDVPEPACPDDGVLVRVGATGVCRSDWHGWQGHDADIAVLPHVPGHELAGTVAAVGPLVRDWAVGDRVTTPFVLACGDCPECAQGAAQVCRRQRQPGFTHWGSFAELVALPAADANLVRLPDAMPFSVAAGLGCRVATAYRAVALVGRAAAGEPVLVVGCGGVGLAAVQVAVALGCPVVAVDPSPGALDLATRFGAVPCAPGPDLAERVVGLTGGGAALSVDAVGSPDALRDGVLSLRRRGRHVQVGLLPQDPLVPMGRVLAWELEVLGSHGLSARDYPGLLDLVASGAVDVAAMVTREVGLDDAGRALVDVGVVPGVTVVVP